MSSAPWAAVMRDSPALKPSPGVTTPMLAGAASVITAAMLGPCSANAASTAPRSLYGRTRVSAAVAGVTPAEPGRARVATPEGAEGEAAIHGGVHGLQDGRVRMAEQRRTPGADKVNVFVAVRVRQVGSLR